MNGTESEVAVLGACLAESGAIGEVADFLMAQDFYQEPHREIYNVMLDLWSLGEPVSEVTVTAKLRDRKKLKLAGGAAYLSEISWTADAGNIDYYAKEVKKNSLDRRIRTIGKLLETDDSDPYEKLNKTLSELVEASASSLKSVPQSIGGHVERVCDRAIKINNKEITNPVILTGLPRLDARTGGLKAGDFIVIGARPSVGKSAFSFYLSKLVAERGHRVLFFSLEMTSGQLAGRMLAGESGVPYSRIADGYLAKADPDLMLEAAARVKNLPLMVDDKSGQSVMDIRTKAMREQVRGGLDLVVVDYIQIAAKDSTDFTEVTAVSNGLKAIAKDLKIPVIGLSQLSRSIENRDSRKPVLSDLRQTGAIEQDADMCFFLWYPDLRKPNNIELVLAKNRNGSLGAIMYEFNKDIQVFTEIGG